MTEIVERLATRVRPLLLAGVPTEGSSELPVVFPFDRSEVARVWQADAELCERALAAAEAAAPAVAALPPFRRAEILRAAAALVGAREEELARQMTLETGNAIWETRLEVQRAVEILAR